MKNIDCIQGFDSSNLREYTDWESVVTVIVMPIVLAFGLITNSCFIFMVYRVPDMRITINIYLVSLAVADVSFLAISISDKLARHVISPLYGDAGHRGTAGCILIVFLVFTSLLSSELHILVIAFERYYSVCVPLKAQFNQKKRATRLLTATWLVSVLIAASFTPSYADYRLYCLEDTKYSDLSDTYGVCRSVTSDIEIDGANIYINLAQPIVFLTSLVISSVLYVKVLRKLRRVSASLKNRGMAQTTHYRKSKVKQYFNRMLWFNWLVYFTLSAPFQLYAFCDFVSYISGGNSVADSSPLFTTCRLLLYLNSCVNPLVYGAANPKYRSAFMVAYSPSKLQPSNNHDTLTTGQRMTTTKLTIALASVD
ncbi:thyrotropin-releasing hormone receptor-like [Antedon mediterranea]|uniref:thyrotropin-releasing hormone receptor-like n=1 Tax=Antedon mediterranea TaxID=105859 RepID=UPI003AF5AA58